MTITEGIVIDLKVIDIKVIIKVIDLSRDEATSWFHFLAHFCPSTNKLAQIKAIPLPPKLYFFKCFIISHTIYTDFFLYAYSG